MKNTKFHAVVKILKSNMKIVDRDSIHKTHIIRHVHNRALSWIRTSILKIFKSKGAVMQVLSTRR